MELGIRNSKGADIHNWLVPQRRFRLRLRYHEGWVHSPDVVILALGSVPQRRKLKLELYTPVNRCSEFNLQVASSPPLKPDSFGRRW